MLRIRSRLPRVDWGAMRRLYRELGGHLRPHLRQLLLASLAAFGVSLVALLQPWPLKIVFDYVLAPGKTAGAGKLGRLLAGRDAMEVVAFAALAVLALTVLNGLLSYAHSVLSGIVGHKVTASLRARLFAHTQRLPQSYHDYRETGDLMTRLTGDVQLVQELLVDNVVTITSQIFLVAGMLAVMFWLDWQLALASLAITPLFAFAAFRFSSRIKDAARRQRESYGRIVDSMQESLSGIVHVKGFVQEKTRDKLVSKSNDRDVTANVRTTRLEANYARIVEMLNAIGTCLVLWLGATRVRSGHMSPGDLLIFIAYVRRLYRPLQRVARSSTRASKAVVRGEKILEILALRPELHGETEGLSAHGLRGDIRFLDVTFSYSGRVPVLHGVSCHVPAGRTTLLLGPTGAGKSTMAKLLMRLYDPDAGRILIDGNETTRYHVASLRKRITPLAQEAFLFRTSIADNIAFGRRHATREEVEAAAAFVGADAFIRRLPEGYDTLVGEGGLTLSGGQRQWITFARAALRRSPVMIFDEPATGLDIHAEAETKQVLSRLGEGRTLVVITHRLNFLDLAGWIVFVRGGRVEEEGTLEDLVEQRGALFEYLTRSREHLESLRWLDRVVEREGSR